MNDRRDFLKKTVLVAGGLVISNSAKSLASPGKFPAGVIYTKDNPGKWAKLPQASGRFGAGET
ncbi:MAG: hypothetical protein ACE5J5_07925 [Candidatus Hydrothermarchaeales archaeon]